MNEKNQGREDRPIVALYNHKRYLCIMFKDYKGQFYRLSRGSKNSFNPPLSYVNKFVLLTSKLLDVIIFVGFFKQRLLFAR